MNNQGPPSAERSECLVEGWKIVESKAYEQRHRKINGDPKHPQETRLAAKGKPFNEQEYDDQ
jgi:hypothetical protein